MMEWFKLLGLRLPGRSDALPKPEGAQLTTSLDKPARLELADTVEVPTVGVVEPGPRTVMLYCWIDAKPLGEYTEELPELGDAFAQFLDDMEDV